jgi:hypothetical protein
MPRGVKSIVTILAILLVGPSVRATEETAAGASRFGTHPIDRISPVSESFESELHAAIESVPDEIWHRISAAGWRVYLAEQVVDAVPGLRGTSPRGWPDGTRWENTDAVHLPAARQLVVAEKRHNKQGRLVACTRVAGVLRHELGHAFDMASGSAGQFLSAQAEFLAAYRADLASMNAEQRAELEYYLQPSDAGRQEAFAEAFGILFGGGSDAARQALFESCFPRTLEAVRQATQLPTPAPAPAGEEAGVPAVANESGTASDVPQRPFRNRIRRNR